jgi:nucleoside-specific outer membrane channel protein Tsx
MKQRLFSCSSLSLFLLWIQPVHAEMLFMDNSLSYLYGEQFANFGAQGITDTQHQSTFTFEHVSAHSWGKVFMFTDFLEKTNEPGRPDKLYGEFSPDLYLTQSDTGLIKNWHIASTLEFNRWDNRRFTNYLVGLGASWRVPWFNWFETKVYYASNQLEDDDVQLTVVWGYSLKLFSRPATLNGYIDYASSAADHKASFRFNPQLLIDISQPIGLKSSKLEVGLEYSHWHNKFGSPVLPEENAMSLMLKWHH